MAIRAKQSKVSLVCGPIFTAPCPVVMAGFVFDLFGRINVVNVQSPNIRKAAARTFTAKAGYKFKLFAPVVRVLCLGVSIPPSLLTLWFAKLSGAFRAALSAVSCSAPSGFQIADLATVFPCAILNAVGVHLRFSTAMLARDFDAGFFHERSIPKYASEIQPGYFEIACKRIRDAYSQPDMFIEQEKAKPAEQLDFL